MKILTILGTRPEIIKLSPIIPLLDKKFKHILVHTGQHYSYNMDKIFFEELELRQPDYMLEIGSGSHAEQTGNMMIGIEKVLIKEQPDYVIVYADPNTPLAGALAAIKLNIPVVHLEAGCRSFNKKMPEEINRIVADHCSEILVAADEAAYNNLKREGLDVSKAYIVGSFAVEPILRSKYIANKKSNILENLAIKKEEYAVVTIHRAENTDNIKTFKSLIEALNEVSKKIPIIFPMHPRTKKIVEVNKMSISKQIIVLEPLGYLDFIKLMDNSLFIMSDSGGIQEEAAVIDIPCLILRNETEWTYLTDAGKNMLLGTDKNKIISKATALLKDREKLRQMKKIRVPIKTGVADGVVKIFKKLEGKNGNKK